MSCDDFKKKVHEHCMGRLSEDQVEQLHAHSARCAECARFMQVSQELTCKEFTNRLNDYVEGVLPPDRQAIFERHLTVCTDCVTYLDSYRATMKMSALAMKPALRKQAEMPDELIEAMLSAEAESQNDPDDVN